MRIDLGSSPSMVAALHFATAVASIYSFFCFSLFLLNIFYAFIFLQHNTKQTIYTFKVLTTALQCNA
jgi:hypothetical protein